MTVRRWFAAGVGGGVVGALVVALAQLDADKIGALAGLIGAVGAIGTLAWAVFLNDRQNDRQHTLDERARAEHERSQAEQVAVWVTKCRSDSSGNACEVVARNGSLLPIYEATIAVLDWEWYRTREVVKLDGCTFHVIEPESTTNPTEFELDTAFYAQPPPVRINPPLMLEFYDARNRHWRRMPDGRLVLLPDPENAPEQ